jgi:hypothetical protein
LDYLFFNLVCKLCNFHIVLKVWQKKTNKREHYQKGKEVI